MSMARSFPGFRRVAALLLATMQLGFVIATLAERSERAAVSHVEPDGTRLHAIHDEAFCPACQGSLSVGRVEDPMRGAPMHRSMGMVTAVARTSLRADHLTSLHGSRAPPVA